MAKQDKMDTPPDWYTQAPRWWDQYGAYSQAQLEKERDKLSSQGLTTTAQFRAIRHILKFISDDGTTPQKKKATTKKTAPDEKADTPKPRKTPEPEPEGKADKSEDRDRNPAGKMGNDARTRWEQRCNIAQPKEGIEYDVRSGKEEHGGGLMCTIITHADKKGSGELMWLASFQEAIERWHVKPVDPKASELTYTVVNGDGVWWTTTDGGIAFEIANHKVVWSEKGDAGYARARERARALDPIASSKPAKGGTRRKS